MSQGENLFSTNSVKLNKPNIYVGAWASACLSIGYIVTLGVSLPIDPQRVHLVTGEIAADITSSLIDFTKRYWQLFHIRLRSTKKTISAKHNQHKLQLLSCCKILFGFTLILRYIAYKSLQHKKMRKQFFVSTYACTMYNESHWPHHYYHHQHYHRRRCFYRHYNHDQHHLKAIAITYWFCCFYFKGCVFQF